MAFGTTLTITVNAVAKILTRIKQEGYGSEYLLRSTTEEYRLKIRHSKEAPKTDGKVFDRHNVELTHTVFATSTTPEIIRQEYVVIRNSYMDDLTQVGYGLSGFTAYVNNATVQSDLLTWQS